jgi:hypothetical protein
VFARGENVQFRQNQFVFAPDCSKPAASLGQTPERAPLAAKALPAFLAALLVAALVGCAASPPAQYAGKGGMTAYKIAPEVYVYHYEKGFTGPDAMGWDPNLQFAWSRFAAAKTCGIPYSQEKAVASLIQKYQQDKLTHERIGIEFHHLQSKGVTGFCTQERVTEIKAVVPSMEAGSFANRF